jgi:hypothetical protein
MENQENNQAKQNTTEPNVHLFGEQIKSKQKHNCECGCGHGHRHHDHDDPCRCHRHHTGGMIFGLGILFVGVLLLLGNAGIVPKEVWIYILPFWPVLLILVGFGIILGHGFVSHFIVSLLTLATFCLIIMYALISVNSPLITYWHIPAGLVDFINQFKY